jgi:hypothetical protein
MATLEMRRPADSEDCGQNRSCHFEEMGGNQYQIESIQYI